MSTEQLATRFATSSRTKEGAVDADRPTTNTAEEGVEAGFDTNVDVEATFPGSSYVTRTSSMVCTFLVNEELVPINIERIPGHYRLFILFSIICV